MAAPLQKGKKTTRRLVLEYFERIKAGDIRGLLNLFSNDSVICEPFSKTKCLSGRLEIEPFLETIIVVNKGMQYDIRMEREQDIDEDRVVALVTFHRGGSVRGKFSFQFNRNGEASGTTIKTLDIEFTG